MLQVIGEIFYRIEGKSFCGCLEIRYLFEVKVRLKKLCAWCRKGGFETEINWERNVIFLRDWQQIHVLVLVFQDNVHAVLLFWSRFWCTSDVFETMRNVAKNVAVDLNHAQYANIIKALNNRYFKICVAFKQLLCPAL